MEEEIKKPLSQLLPHRFHHTKKIGASTDAELSQIVRSNYYFYTMIGKMSGVAKSRARAAQSHLDKRKAKYGPLTAKPTPDDGTRIAVKTPTKISDHAVIRYLQRKHNLNLQAVHEEMTANVVAGESFMDGKFVMHDGMCYILSEQDVIKTVYPEDWHTEEHVDDPYA
jgi:hypothetical protein